MELGDCDSADVRPTDRPTDATDDLRNESRFEPACVRACGDREMVTFPKQRCDSPSLTRRGGGAAAVTRSARRLAVKWASDSASAVPIVGIVREPEGVV